MSAVLIGSLACSLYLLSAAIQFVGLEREIKSRQIIVRSIAILAIGLHSFFNYQKIMTPEGVNVGLYPMLSLISLAVTSLVLFSSLRRTVDNLLIAILPLAAFAIALALLSEGNYAPRNDLSGGIIIHIIFSVIAYGILTIAVIQAGLLSLGDYELKRHNMAVLRHIPPLQTMDTLLFELLWAGLILLSLSIASGFMFLNDIARPGLLHHTAITLSAWVVFAILLWGRYKLGWRGSIASRWTLIGFMLLVLGYFGSKLVLEVLLGRT
ncbi:MAG: cytochrome c biogenesis protein CcsA [Pseudomonadales bacterium]|nr:cytochrome c biogenesis protein CcsA [Pseudomonadales bacterium]